jgi:serine/threonine-protein kinase RsbW
MHTILDVPARVEALPLIHAHAQALAAMVGFDAAHTAAIELACEEAFGLILERVSGASASPVRIGAILSPLDLHITFDDREIPPLAVAVAVAVAVAPVAEGAPSSLDVIDLSAISQQLIRHSADEARWQPMGRQGNRLALTFKRPDPDITASSAPESLVPFDDAAPLAPEQAYTIRAAGTDGADDWSQIARAMYRTYGFSYIDDFYIPDRIRALNSTGQVLSVVAVTDAGEIARAWSRPALGA